MIVPIKVTGDGEHYFEIPGEYLKELGWQAGDSVIWTQNDDGSFSLTKTGNEPRLISYRGSGQHQIPFFVS